MYNRFFYLLISIVLLFISHDNFNLSYLSRANSIAWTEKFSLLEWELVNLPQKWTFMVWHTLTTSNEPNSSKLENIERYMELSKRVNKYEQLLDSSRNTYLKPQNIRDIQQHTKELKNERDNIRLIAEKSIEDEITETLKNLHITNKLGFVFPPVDIRLQNIPKVLVTSPRQEIRLVDAILIDPEISFSKRDSIESALFQAYNTSALIDDLSGVATYPLLVDDQQSLRRILQSSVHEWFHTYFFFKPLGWNYWDTQEMSTINETVCTLLGEEIGDLIYFKLYENDKHTLIDSTSIHSDDQLINKMRSTRIKVDQLLSENKINSAEQLMKETWWELRLGGYRIRKLNQAYFAFRGRYGNSPASISNIGNQVNILREYSANISYFINLVSEINDYDEFLKLTSEANAKTE